MIRLHFCPSKDFPKKIQLVEIYIENLLHAKPMVIGSFYEVYKTCSKANCCCKKGKKHGSFPALSISIAGKRGVKMVRKKDLAIIRRKASEAHQIRGLGGLLNIIETFQTPLIFAPKAGAINQAALRPDYESCNTF